MAFITGSGTYQFRSSPSALEPAVIHITRAVRTITALVAFRMKYAVRVNYNPIIVIYYNSGAIIKY